MEAGGGAAGEGEVMSGLEDWSILLMVKGSGREGGEKVPFTLVIEEQKR